MRDNVRSLRDFYLRSSKALGQEQWQEEWTKTIGQLDALLERLEHGAFDHRLRLAVGRTVSYDEVIFEGREYYGFQVRILQLARETCRDPSLMTDAAYMVLGDKEALNRHEFAIFPRRKRRTS